MTARGKYRHPIVIEAVTENRQPGGTVKKLYKRMADNWAAIRTLSARERFAAQQVQSDADTEISMPFIPGVTSKHSIRFGQRVFDIRGVDNVEQRDEELVLLCTEHL